MTKQLESKKIIRRPRIVKKRGEKVGLPPGTPVLIGRKKIEKIQISILEYEEEKFEERQVSSIDDFLPIKEKPTITWINIEGLHDLKILEKIKKIFNLHPLLLEDVLNTDQRPKFDDYDTYLYLVLKSLEYDELRGNVIIDQISFILGENYVISFQEQPVDIFNPIRKRIRGKKGKIRSYGADHLLYTLLDVVVDHYFLVLERLSDKIEIVEEEVVSTPEIQTLQNIHQLKTNLIFLRKAVWPLREIISRLERSGSPLISIEKERYIRDVYDHIIHIIDTIETLRDIVSAMVDIYLSSMSNRMNEVMKVLTIIATILIPMTVISGIYGMNFQNMPELAWPLGYPIALTLMLMIAAILVIYFWRKGWI
ncbi:MAG: magnesium/cobalt transporter CorA [Candidatus Thorarchaeota archaeon]